MSVRNMQRKRQVHQEYGYNGLFDRRRGKKSYHRVPMETAETGAGAVPGKIRQLERAALSREAA
jgi:hypothetical protein